MSVKKRCMVHNLTFAFAKAKTNFFENCSIEFQPGSLNFVRGKNGAGKSTLLRLLRGISYAGESLQGELEIEGQRYPLAHNDKSLISFVPQDVGSLLVSSSSFTQNRQFALMDRFPSLAPLPLLPEMPSFLERYGIHHDLPVSSLSGGQRQILGIMMVLSRNAKIVLLDEPTAALDEENADILIAFLKELAMITQITVILIVHQQELVERYCALSYFELRINDESGSTTRSIVKKTITARID